ncbi:nicotinate phosphoribosyltransferase [Acetobacteraceae bacterium ESL0709]|nr:nicotinate phosphoribosyltransferase [Acetobacteraceae bacterium ESL0697]MDF7677694.1 nicotinate phosphoribosyltransferase [Acetobacteraceae bacterium ESL0709]
MTTPEEALDAACGPRLTLTEEDILSRTDVYFERTREIVRHFGDKYVTYAVFIRRPVIAACGLALAWLRNVAREQNFSIEIEEHFSEGEWVGAGEALFYLTGSFSDLVLLETMILQKTGAACVAAYNAYQMAITMPDTPFLAMEARHCAGAEMQELMAYAAAVGSRAAQKEGARGFIGNANHGTSGFFGMDIGLGTMPHALIGYAGSTVRAAEMYAELYPHDQLVVLVDYFGQEITDTLAVCTRFPERAARGEVSIRLDTHGARFLEGLDTTSSYEVLERHNPGIIRHYCSDRERRYLVGMGVSAAAIWYMREALDKAGFPKVKIIASSGFSITKCMTIKAARAPVDVVGTGSFLPKSWSETYATADIIAYDGQMRVKVGREFLLKSFCQRAG